MSPITYTDVRHAWRRIEPYLEPTPLRRYPALDALTGAQVFVKHENLQPTHAFKVRNAFSALGLLETEERRRGVIAATRGNHGLGLCYAGGVLGIPVTICVPKGNNPEKNAAIRAFGARLVEEGRDYDETLRTAAEIASRERLRTIHSTNDLGVIAGAATLTDELLDQLPRPFPWRGSRIEAAESVSGSAGNAESDAARRGAVQGRRESIGATAGRDQGSLLDAFVVAVGGGSQAVGAITVLTERSPTTQVWGVQAANAPSQQLSWLAGENVTTESADTIADGLATRTSYDLTREALREGLSRFLLVSEDELRSAIRVFLEATRSLAEPAGAAGLAGLLQCREELRGKRVGIVLSGANIDRATLQRVLSD